MRIKVSRFGSLEEAKADAKRAIDERAEEIRTLVLTPGAGQAMEYQAAAEEAKAFAAGEDRDYPMLQAAVDAGTDESLAGAAQNVADASRRWQALGARIRRARLAGKAAVEIATSAREVNDARRAAFAELAQIANEL